jgi:hypothetical protein
VVDVLESGHEVRLTASLLAWHLKKPRPLSPCNTSLAARCRASRRSLLRWHEVMRGPIPSLCTHRHDAKFSPNLALNTSCAPGASRDSAARDCNCGLRWTSLEAEALGGAGKSRLFIPRTPLRLAIARLQVPTTVFAALQAGCTEIACVAHHVPYTGVRAKILSVFCPRSMSSAHSKLHTDARAR